jgi:glycine betaine/proline transport system substrate-binding protein
MLKNLEFSLEMENQLMEAILNQNVKPSKAAQQWLKDNPQQVEAWLKGVKTLSGDDAAAAVNSYIKSNA